MLAETQYRVIDKLTEVMGKDHLADATQNEANRITPYTFMTSASLCFR
jgi:hypothetical protein